MLVKPRSARGVRADAPISFGATAGYLQISLTAELVMSALEIIQPGSFGPLELANDGDTSVLASTRIFSAFN